MAWCAACNHDVAASFFLDMDAWRHLVCPHCQARLELKPPRSVVLGPLMAPLFVLARQGRVFEVIAFAHLCSQPFSFCCWKASVLNCGSGKGPCPSPPSGSTLT